MAQPGSLYAIRFSSHDFTSTARGQPERNANPPEGEKKSYLCTGREEGAIPPTVHLPTFPVAQFGFLEGALSKLYHFWTSFQVDARSCSSPHNPYLRKAQRQESTDLIRLQLLSHLQIICNLVWTREDGKGI